MAGVSVTIESLNDVKRAFSDFQTDVESSSDKISSCTEQILVEVEQSVKKQENVVTVLEDKVSSLINEIEQIQSTIISVNARISSLKTEIVNLEKQRPQWETRLSQMKQQKRQLEAQRNNSRGDTSGIEAQIRAIENQIQNCRRTLSQINEQIASAKKQQADNERKRAELKDSKTRKENDLSTTKSELSRAKSKLERLSAAGDSVEREIANLNMAARKFERNSTSSNAASKAGVDKCIAEIEEYMSVNLSASGSNISAPSSPSQIDLPSSMNTPEELQLIREMEANGAFDVSSLELLNSPRSMSGSRIPAITIELPANTRRYSIDSFSDQVLGQEDGLNTLSVYDFLTNYENRQNNGRDPQSTEAQHEYRQALIEMLMEDFLAETPDISPEQARAEAVEAARLLAALHNPDQTVGGFGFNVTGAGARNVNCALGSLWRHGRARSLYEQVRSASSGWSEEQMRNTYLNVRLHVVDRYA